MYSEVRTRAVPLALKMAAIAIAALAGFAALGMAGCSGSSTASSGASSETARDKDGKKLLVEEHAIKVKDAPSPSLVVTREEDASIVDTFLLKGCNWKWTYGEGYHVDWKVTDLDSGKVYDDSTHLVDLDPKHNGGIEAEFFANYKWPAMTAIFGKPGNYEISATLVTAAGKEISSSATLHVK